MARLVEAGSFFRVTVRGNYRQNVFFSDQDRAEYLGLLAHHAALEGLDILGWCCMTNHIHLLAVPQRRESLARSMRRVQSDCSQRLNRRHGWRSGHLWQSRFYSCVASGDTAWTVLRVSGGIKGYQSRRFRPSHQAGTGALEHTSNAR